MSKMDLAEKLDSSLIRGVLPVTVLADIMRQGAGVSILNRDPKTGSATTIGTHMLARTGGITITSDLNSVATESRSPTHTPNVWIDDIHPSSPLVSLNPQMELVQDELHKPFKLEELAKLHQAVQHRITAYFTDESSHAGLPLPEAKLEAQASEELPKILAIREALENINTSAARSCHNTLSDLSRIITTYTAPELPYEKSDVHFDKASRILRSDRAIHLLHVLSKQGAANYAMDLEVETIDFAFEVNHLRLVHGLSDHLHKNNPDFSLAGCRQEIITQILPRIQEVALTDPSKTNEVIIKDLFPILAPIINYVVDNYPHDDTASLLGLNLENKLANCAGKTDMLNMLFRDLGLDSRESVVQIKRYKTLFGHKYNHIYLPSDTILEIDGNQSSSLFGDEEALFHCNVSILQKNQNLHPIAFKDFPTWEELMREHHAEYVIENNRLQQYRRTWGVETHKVTSDSKPGVAIFDVNNLYLEYVNDLSNQSPRASSAKYYRASGMLEFAIRTNDHETNMKRAVSNDLLNIVIEATNYSNNEKIEYLGQIQTVLLGCIEESPYYVFPHLDLIRLLRYQANLTQNPAQKKLLYQEIDKHYEKSLFLSRVLPKEVISQHTQIDILNQYIQYSREPNYYKYALDDKSPLIRNHLRELIFKIERNVSKGSNKYTNSIKNVIDNIRNEITYR